MGSSFLRLLRSNYSNCVRNPIPSYCTVRDLGTFLGWSEDFDDGANEEGFSLLGTDKRRTRNMMLDDTFQFYPISTPALLTCYHSSLKKLVDGDLLSPVQCTKLQVLLSDKDLIRNMLCIQRFAQFLFLGT